ncbi:MAG: hypothetical protein M1168_01105 [Candidatus Marsarchaeota archaeon]|nr:hypothetical protein [Candidatus Marsarchaeota archaeon]MCL5094564.1 hypothetical protein [Candidatus Marsarchaeota archaeon]
MLNVVKYSLETYFKHIILILFSSIAFFIALLIPIFASFPTYNDAGGIFLRFTNIFNLGIFNIFIIIVSVLFSLLFLSFAIVSINVIVKHKRTYSKIKNEVIQGLEKYTGKVFLVLLLFSFIAIAVPILLNKLVFGFSGLVSAVILLCLIPIFFYAPSSIVIDDSKTINAIKKSISFFSKKFNYFILWLIIAVVLITLFDFIFTSLFPTLISIFIMLIFNSIFILPFLVILQAESYMKRFALLKH